MNESLAGPRAPVVRCMDRLGTNALAYQDLAGGFIPRKDQEPASKCKALEWRWSSKFSTQK